jgi:uncharacterized membrane protein
MVAISRLAIGPTEMRRTRIALVDALRGTALAAMIVYHFSWDLELFELVPLDVTGNPLWVASAWLIAGSFLALAGVSLVLAHGERLNAWSFARRLTMIAAAAGAITLVSWYFEPGGVILFGILHCIAVSSILGLAFLRMPVAVILIAAAACFAAPAFLSAPLFNAPGWLWLGLASEPRPSNDYVPLLPWFGTVLIGIAGARLALARASKAEWSRWQPRSAVSRMLALAGRHSLAVYLVHQAILLSALWLVVKSGLWPK